MKTLVNALMLSLITLTGCVQTTAPTAVAPSTMLPAATMPVPSATPTPLPPTTVAALSATTPTLAPSATPQPYRVSDDIPYGATGDPAQTLKLYLPENGNSALPVLFVQGGETMPDLVRYFATRRYPVITFNVRGNLYQEEIQDVFCALAWAHTNAVTYGFDPRRIVPVGVSMSGGNVAILALAGDTTPFMAGCPHTLPATGRVQAVVTLAGVFDYSAQADFFTGFIEAISDFMGGAPDQVPEVWTAASAITWVKGSAPPFLLVHGMSDTNVAARQSQEFASALEAAGGTVEVLLIPGITHPGISSNPQAFEAMAAYLERLPTATMTSAPVPEQTIATSAPPTPTPTSLLPITSSGDLIAFTALSASNERNSAIGLVNADGSGLSSLPNSGGGASGWAPDWSPDGQWVAYIVHQNDNSWPLYIIGTDGGHKQRVTSGTLDHFPDWSPDGTRIVFARHGAVWVMRVMPGEPIAVSDFQQLTDLPQEVASNPVWSPDGAQIAFTSQMGDPRGRESYNDPNTAEIYVMNADGTTLHKLTENAIPDYKPTWSPDGAQIAFTSIRDGDAELYIMNADGSAVRQVTDNAAADSAPAWSPDGMRLVYTSDQDGYSDIYVIPVAGGAPTRLTNTPELDFYPTWKPAPAATPATTPGYSSSPNLMNISTATVSQVKLQTTLRGHTTRVCAVAFSSDGRWLASAGQRNEVKVWDLTTQQAIKSFQHNGDWGIFFLANDRQLATNTGEVWDIESGEMVHSASPQATFSPDGHWMAAAASNSPIELWNTDTWQVERTLDRHSDAVIGMAFSADSTLLATGSAMGPDDIADISIKVWAVADGRELFTLKGHSEDIHAVAFSPDGNFLASGSIDQTVKIWDVKSGQLIRTLHHGNGIMDVTFSPDGTLVASAGADGNVKLWDATNGRLLKTLTHPDELKTVAFSPDGTLLASGGYDNLVYLWGIPK